MLLWIAYAAGAALLSALAPVFIKAGARRTAPAVGALLFAFVALLFSFGVVLLQGTIPSFAAFDWQSIALLILSGLTNGCMWLCLFRAIAGGPVNRVMPINALSSILLLVSSLLFFGARIWLWRICFMLLVLIGTVLMESRTQKTRGAAWLIYAGFAMLFAALSDLFAALCPMAVTFPVETFLRTAAAFLFLLVVAAVGRAFSSFGEMGASGWCFTLLGGIAAGGAWVCRFYSECYGEWDLLLPITCLILPMTLLFSRICLKERMPGAAVLGMLLALGGNFALLMNF